MLKIERLPDYCSGRNAPHPFHPSIAELVDGALLMTCQPFVDSDCYGTPEYLISNDKGKTWSAPQQIESMQARNIDTDLIRGVADIRTFSMPDGGAFTIGVTSHRTPCGNINWDKNIKVKPRQYPVYTIFQPNRGYSQLHELKTPLMPENWRIACAQLAVTPAGTMIMPVYFEDGRTLYAGFDSPQFSAMTIEVELADGLLKVLGGGNVLRHPVLRGFCEPSVVFFRNHYYLTMRAEDGFGYWAMSEDGLNWGTPRKWSWRNGEPLVMSSTQQHWVVVSDKLYLVYTRNAGFNSQVVRYRAPLFIAEFDLETGLDNSTEQTVLPYQNRDGMDGRLGNFACLSCEDGSALVSDAALFLRAKDGKITDFYTEAWIARLTQL